jgi:hypothetical protein
VPAGLRNIARDVVFNLSSYPLDVSFQSSSGLRVHGCCLVVVGVPHNPHWSVFPFFQALLLNLFSYHLIVIKELFKDVHHSGFLGRAHQSPLYVKIFTIYRVFCYAICTLPALPAYISFPSGTLCSLHCVLKVKSSSPFLLTSLSCFLLRHLHYQLYQPTSAFHPAPFVHFTAFSKLNPVPFFC